jgi:hypothetical protein
MALFEEVARLVREVPGVQAVTANVRVAENGAPGQPGGAREQIQQKLHSRGLLRASSADRWVPPWRSTRRGTSSSPEPFETRACGERRSDSPRRSRANVQ